MEQHTLKKCKKFFEYQHSLLLRDISWSKFKSIIFKCCSIFSTPVLIRQLLQLKRVVFLHMCCSIRIQIKMSTSRGSLCSYKAFKSFNFSHSFDRGSLWAVSGLRANAVKLFGVHLLTLSSNLDHFIVVH